MFVPNIEEAIELIGRRLVQSTGFTFFTLNLHHLANLNKVGSFRRAYEAADFICADGWPVALLMRRRSKTSKRTTGADLFMPLCRFAARHDLPVCLFGSSSEGLRRAVVTIRRDCPGIVICRAVAPSSGFDPCSPEADAHIKLIAESGARLCFVALGAPKQEVFAARAYETCPATGFVGVGAAIDFVAGLELRAPDVIQALNLEWAWRLSRSPRRLHVRYLQCLVLLLELLVSRTRREALHDLVGLR